MYLDVCSTKIDQRLGVCIFGNLHRGKMREDCAKIVRKRKHHDDIPTLSFCNGRQLNSRDSEHAVIPVETHLRRGWFDR